LLSLAVERQTTTMAGAKLLIAPSDIVTLEMEIDLSPSLKEIRSDEPPALPHWLPTSSQFRPVQIARSWDADPAVYRTTFESLGLRGETPNSLGLN
jgi:hypothetical protein